MQTAIVPAKIAKGPAALAASIERPTESFATLHLWVTLSNMSTTSLLFPAWFWPPAKKANCPTAVAMP